MPDLSDLFDDEERKAQLAHEAWLRDPKAQAEWKAQQARNAERAARELANAGPSTDDCPQCDGEGQVDGDECPYCDGTGQVPAAPEESE